MEFCVTSGQILKSLMSLWTGLILMIMSVVAFFYGTLPDNPSRPWGNPLRRVVWPAFLIWVIVRVLT